MKKIIFVFAILLSASFLSAQAFNGTINFKYTTQKDTSTNLYMVKNKVIRLDQFGKNGNIQGSFIFDLGQNTVKFLNPKRKLWGTQKSETPQVIRGECIVIKGTDVKTISSMKCTEYTVKNAEENTVITYWIAEGTKFTFFKPMVTLWNRKDKQSIYFGQIKGIPTGSMPMLSEERQLTDGKLLTKLEVISIDNTPPKESNFEIPEGYSKFDQ